VIERVEIENDLLGEIADHFTGCGDAPGSYAGLVIESVRHQQGSVVLYGYDRTSSTPFTATARVQVQLLDKSSATSPSATARDEEQHRPGGPDGRGADRG
jgi:hypothetical protein